MYISMLFHISEITLNYFGKWWLKLNLKFENLSLMGFNMKFEVL